VTELPALPPETAMTTPPSTALPTTALPTTALPTTALPTTTLPTTAPVGAAASATTLGSSDPLGAHPVEHPTTELRGPIPRPEQPRGSGSGPLPTNIYRSRRPGLAILLVIPAVGVGVLLVRALAIAAFGDPFDIAGIISSICGLASLPFMVAGVYGLVTGAAHGAEHYGFRVWARPPLAYLIVGLSFVLAAGLAIR
jgi:hypothetical protein